MHSTKICANKVHLERSNNMRFYGICGYIDSSPFNMNRVIWEALLRCQWGHYESLVNQKRYHLMWNVLIFSVLIALCEDQTKIKYLLFIKGGKVNASEKLSSLQSNIISEYHITSKDFTIQFLVMLAIKAYLRKSKAQQNYYIDLQ